MRILIVANGLVDINSRVFDSDVQRIKNDIQRIERQYPDILLNIQLIYFTPQIPVLFYQLRSAVKEVEAKIKAEADTMFIELENHFGKGSLDKSIKDQYYHRRLPEFVKGLGVDLVVDKAAHGDQATSSIPIVKPEQLGDTLRELINRQRAERSVISPQ